MIDPWEVKIGELVSYRQPHMSFAELGIISSLHGIPTYIHVLFSGDTTAKACSPRDLDLVPESQKIS